jgi:hypothetical protein
MQMVEQKPDAYGPVWVCCALLIVWFITFNVVIDFPSPYPLRTMQISTTLVFVAAVTSNISAWLSSWMQGQNW